MNKAIQGFEHIYIDKKSPLTLLLLHGTGGNEHDLVPLGEDLDFSANILSPRGQVIEDGMPRFFKRLSPGVFDFKDLEKRSNELANFIVESSKTYGFSLNGLVAVGYSNGANIALHLMTDKPEVLKMGILFRPMSEALSKKMPPLTQTKVLILSGLMDEMVGSEDTDKLTKALTAKGADAEVKKIAAGHGLTRQDVEYSKAWLRSVADNLF